MGNETDAIPAFRELAFPRQETLGKQISIQRHDFIAVLTKGRRGGRRRREQKRGRQSGWAQNGSLNWKMGGQKDLIEGDI